MVLGCVRNARNELANAPVHIFANTVYHLRVRAVGKRIQLFGGEASQPLIDVTEDQLASRLAGVEDLCAEGDYSRAGFSRLMAKEIGSQRGDFSGEPKVP